MLILHGTACFMHVVAEENPPVHRSLVAQAYADPIPKGFQRERKKQVLSPCLKTPWRSQLQGRYRCTTNSVILSQAPNQETNPHPVVPKHRCGKI